MAFFELTSRVTITSSVSGVGMFVFSGVHDVKIKKSIHSIVETAVMTLPSIAKYIPKNGSVPVMVTTGQMFNDRDPITIELGYNGDYQTEFEGFIKRRDLAMPLVVECEGYVQQLRLDVAVSGKYNKKNTSVRELLQLACDQTGDVTLAEGLPDITLSGIILDKVDGVRICDYIKEATDHTLTIFFISPKVLWYGLVYSAYAAAPPVTGEPQGVSVFGLGNVSYRIGFNCPRDNGLKQRIPSEPVQIIMNGKLASAVQVYTASKAAYAKRKVKSMMNHVGDNDTLGKLAQEKEYFMNYTGFEGKLQGFLQPYATPGFDAYVQDAQYPELEGTYVIESTEVTFGVRGARRVCEVGPRVGFDNG